jgi:hypothetical protein
MLRGQPTQCPSPQGGGRDTRPLWLARGNRPRGRIPRERGVFVHHRAGVARGWRYAALAELRHPAILYSSHSHRHPLPAILRERERKHTLDAQLFGFERVQQHPPQCLLDLALSSAGGLPAGEAHHWRSHTSQVPVSTRAYSPPANRHRAPRPGLGCRSRKGRSPQPGRHAGGGCASQLPAPRPSHPSGAARSSPP